VDEVDLSKVRLRRVALDSREVLHGLARVRVALDADALDQDDLVDRGLGESVGGIAVHGDDLHATHPARNSSPGMT
jgi:predicted ThiF/HesA family dinucleotide-utilizing enzyme